MVVCVIGERHFHLFLDKWRSREKDPQESKEMVIGILKSVENSFVGIFGLVLLVGGVGCFGTSTLLLLTPTTIYFQLRSKGISYPSLLRERERERERMYSQRER